MKTLQEVFEQDAKSVYPFDVNFNKFFMTVHGKSKSGLWIAEDKAGRIDTYNGLDKGWSLHIPPKPKKKLYQWVYSEYGGWFVSGGFFEDESKFRRVKSNVNEVRRLDHTLIEVDAD